MSDKTKILIQLDADEKPSVFDRVVAVDSGAQQLFSYGSVTAENVVPLVHGAIFTRGPADLKHTALFIGGSSVEAGEAILKAVTRSFLGPLRCSVMLDANGANTTAAAAVLAARRHVNLAETRAAVLAGTGPVGQRAARLLAREGAAVLLGSRTLDKAQRAADAVNQAVGGAKVTPLATADPAKLAADLAGVNVVIAAGAAGARLIAWDVIKSAGVKVAIDLNAVPPSGIEKVDVMDKAKERDGVLGYGAIGVGGLKMKIHKAAVAGLFESNDKVLDAEAIYAIGKSLA